MLGMGPGSVLAAGHQLGWRNRLAGRATVTTIAYLDGPRAGTSDELALGADGLPPRQLCALVRRAADEGGDYTLPYQRAVRSEDDQMWLYTQGWQHATRTGVRRVEA